MPSPVAHSLTGYLIYQATGKSAEVPRWRFMILCLIVANAPDLDFIPGLFVGDLDRYHHGISHSIGFAALFAFVFGIFETGWKKSPIGRNFAIFFCLYCSHIILDSLSVDTRFPHGIPFFWPLSEEYFIAPFAFLPPIRRVSSGIELILDLFLPHNIQAMSIELLLLFPFLLLIVALKKKENPSSKNSIH